MSSLLVLAVAIPTWSPIFGDRGSLIGRRAICINGLTIGAACATQMVPPERVAAAELPQSAVVLRVAEVTSIMEDQCAHRSNPFSFTRA
mmetsp:Transcript_8182/g.18295  ORF Transcript_8182/g.18295 Transcript_8182/m.18295 type:complete len:89 (+) Transcript_8182:21-287(+)